MHPQRFAVAVVAATLALTGWSSSGAAVAAPSEADVLSSVRSAEDLPDVAAATADDGGVRIAVLSDRDDAAGPSDLAVDTLHVPTEDVADATRALQDLPGVISAEVDTRVRAVEDPYASQQYSTSRVRADRVRTVASGSGTVVAVIDTGVQGNHPDLSPALGDSRPRVLAGTTFLAPTADGPDLNGLPGNVDPNGHGTHVAGIIAAAAGNGIGTEGIAPDAQILPVRALDSAGYGWSSDLAAAILWAHGQGADVINLSLAGPSRSQAVSTAIDTVTTDTSRGKAPTIVVAAAGNSGTNYAEMWPAAHARAIAVASSDSADRVAASSSRGSWVDVAAPGVSILSTCPTTVYCYRSGTSMASPLVAGAAALLRQQSPARAGTDVATILQSTAYDIDLAGRDTASGWGRIDVAAALDPSHFPKVPRPVRLPTGSLTEVTVQDRTIVVRGRAVDTDGSPVVRVVSTVDGRRTTRDLRPAGSTGGNFAIGWTDVPGTHSVCVTMLDNPTSRGVGLGCRDAVVK